MDSLRGVPDTIALTVHEFSIDTGVATLVMIPSRLMQGGGGYVELDTLGTVLFVRLYQ